MDHPLSGDPPDRISHTPTALSVYFSPQSTDSGREVRTSQPASIGLPLTRRSPPTQQIDPFLSLSPLLLEIDVVEIQLIHIGSVAERNSPQDELVRHPVYRLVGIRAPPGTVIGVGSHVSSQWWEGRIRSVRSVHRHFIRYTCDRGDHPFAIVDVPVQESEVPWVWFLKQATRHFASCMLGCHV